MHTNKTIIGERSLSSVFRKYYNVQTTAKELQDV